MITVRTRTHEFLAARGFYLGVERGWVALQEMLFFPAIQNRAQQWTKSPRQEEAGSGECMCTKDQRTAPGVLVGVHDLH